VLQDLK